MFFSNPLVHKNKINLINFNKISFLKSKVYNIIIKIQFNWFAINQFNLEFYSVNLVILSRQSIEKMFNSLKDSFKSVNGLYFLIS